MLAIKRKAELDKLFAFKDKNLIKVVTGVRHAGKSTLLLQFQELLKTESPKVSLISINMDLPEFSFLTGKKWEEIYDYIKSLLRKDVTNYVFIDEIQNIREFEKLLEELFVTPNVDLYVAGSSAYLLSGEPAAPLLTGKTFEINIFPFSFVECLESTGKIANPSRAFTKYLRTGGFPEVIGFAESSENFAYNYLKTIFQNIYKSDVKKRYKIYHEKSYIEVANFLINSLGSKISARNISKILTTDGKRIDNKTASKYIDILVESCFFYKVTRYDIKGKRHLTTLEKYYLADWGLRYSLPGNGLAANTEQLFENIIFLELKRRNSQIWIGKANDFEIDFIVSDENGNTQYIQVAYTVQEPKVLARKLAPLTRIPASNERLLITMDNETANHKGIKQIYAIDWLLNK